VSARRADFCSVPLRAHLLSRCAFAAFPEQDRRGPWFYEVTPADRAKLHAVNLDANPLDMLPLREIAEAIDDPFDDEHHQVMIASEKKRGRGRQGRRVRQGGERSDRPPPAPVLSFCSPLTIESLPPMLGFSCLSILMSCVCACVCVCVCTFMPCVCLHGCKNVGFPSVLLLLLLFLLRLPLMSVIGTEQPHARGQLGGGLGCACRGALVAVGWRRGGGWRCRGASGY
jgi:hypothetical protein